MSHKFKVRVFYEDTDFAGLVFYANYFKFVERARSEAIREVGIYQAELKQKNNENFVVRKLVAEFHHSAKFDDDLLIVTRVNGLRKASFKTVQCLYCGSKLLFECESVIVFVRNGYASRLPESLLSAINAINKL